MKMRRRRIPDPERDANPDSPVGLNYRGKLRAETQLAGSTSLAPLSDDGVLELVLAANLNTPVRAAWTPGRRCGVIFDHVVVLGRKGGAP